MFSSKLLALAGRPPYLGGARQKHKHAANVLFKKKVLQSPPHLLFHRLPLLPPTHTPQSKPTPPHTQSRPNPEHTPARGLPRGRPEERVWLSRRREALP